VRVSKKTGAILPKPKREEKEVQKGLSFFSCPRISLCSIFFFIHLSRTLNSLLLCSFPTLFSCTLSLSLSLSPRSCVAGPLDTPQELVLKKTFDESSLFPTFESLKLSALDGLRLDNKTFFEDMEKQVAEEESA
jgi:hypothetical protein